MIMLGIKKLVTADDTHERLVSISQELSRGYAGSKSAVLVFARLGSSETRVEFGQYEVLQAQGETLGNGFCYVLRAIR